MHDKGSPLPSKETLWAPAWTNTTQTQCRKCWTEPSDYSLVGEDVGGVLQPEIPIPVSGSECTSQLVMIL